jgi:hypothetical protein
MIKLTENEVLIALEKGLAAMARHEVWARIYAIKMGFQEISKNR